MRETEHEVTITVHNGANDNTLPPYADDSKPGENAAEFGGGDSQSTEVVDENSSVAMDDFLEARLRKAEDGSSSGDESSHSSGASSSSCSLNGDESLQNTLTLNNPEGSNSSRERSGAVTPPPPEEPIASKTFTPTPPYNPFSNYSPTRPSRKEIMGMSLFSSTESPRIRRPYRHLDSDHALEAYAQQMRAELRYAEMIELAVAAERAAEEGQEKFVARPSTYGVEDEEMARDDHCVGLSSSAHDGVKPSPNLKRPQWRRHSSLPGRNMSPALLSSPASTKLAVMALRDVQEVFPSFQNFHTHLRTHLARDGIRQRSLVFREDSSSTRKNSRSSLGSQSGDGRNSLTPRRSRMNFLRNLDIHEWVRGKKRADGRKSTESSVRPRRSNSFQRQEEAAKSGVVGELVSGHLHSHHEHGHLLRRPQVDVPPGVVAGGDGISSALEKSDIVSNKSGSAQTAETTATTDAISCSSSEDGIIEQTTQSLRRSPSQNAPFEEGRYDGTDRRGKEAAGNGPRHLMPVPATPDVDRAGVGEEDDTGKLGPDFVTPARLRNIRNEKPKALDSMPSLLLPSNSVIESPERMRFSVRRCVEQPLLDIDEAIRESDSRDSSILLPIQLSPDLEMDRMTMRTVNQTDVVNLSSSRAGDFINLSGTGGSSLDMSASAPSQRGSISYSPVPTSWEFDEAPSTPPAQGKIDPLVRTRSTDSKGRKVDISILDGSPDTERSNKTQPQVNESGPSKRDQSPEPAAKRLELIDTPQRDDCGCLSLSPAGSVDSTDSFDLGRVDNRFFSSVSPTALKAMEDPRLWNPFNESSSDGKQSSSSSHGGISGALYMFTRMSPKSRAAESKKRALFFRSRENDDFLNNYLYCSKPLQESGEEASVPATSASVRSEPTCYDNKGPCGELLNPDGCCAAILGEAAMDLAPKRSTSQRSFVSVGGSGPTIRSDAETWFDMATEGFDNVLEQLTGTVQPENGSPWNVSFQAPALKKSVGGSNLSRTLDSNQKGLDAIVENKSDDALDYYVPRSKGRHPSLLSRGQLIGATAPEAVSRKNSKDYDPITILRKSTEESA